MSDPSPAELSWRVDDMSRRQEASLRDINARLDLMPTEKTLLALFVTRDNAISAVGDDVRTLTAALEAERLARQADIRKIESDMKQADKDRRNDRKWTFTAISGSIGLAIAVVGLIIGGLPT